MGGLGAFVCWCYSLPAFNTQTADREARLEKQIFPLSRRGILPLSDSAVT